jgi:4-hydroxy-L-threonine phosphate dehydrogenase PdxA
MSLRHLAITMGDPAGIGPEIIVKAAQRLHDRIASGSLRLLVIGSNPALEAARRKFTPGLVISEVTEADANWPALAARQAGPEGKPILPGVLSADGGRFAFQAVDQGVKLALAGRIGGIVTAPLNKEALNKAGYHYPGHTEMLAELTGVRGSCMMLAH